MSVVLSPAPEPASAASPLPDAEWFIVMNRRSGSSGKDEVRAAIETELRAAGRRHRFVPVPPDGIVQGCRDAARLASGEGGILVAVGGDGTINCAAQAALAQDCPLGIVPQGTFNLFARQLGLPLDPAHATRALLRAAPEAVQVGWANQRVFLVNASLGLYPQLLAERETAKQKLGRRRWIAMLAALKSLLQWRAQLQLDVEIDGELRHLRAASVFVCNNRLQLQRVGIPEDVVSQVGEGRLACLFVRPLSTWAKLRMLGAAALGRLGDEQVIDSLAIRSMTVGTRHVRLKVATDGEVLWMQSPVRLTVAPRPLHVMLPPPGERLPPR